MNAAASGPASWAHVATIDELEHIEGEESDRLRGLFGVFDTEDDSKELMEAGRSGFDKQLTQIAAVTVDGRRFHNRGENAEFRRWLLRQCVRGVRRWYAHNLQYDLGNLFADELDDVDMVMVGGRLVRATWRGVIFLDSFNLFPVKAATLGKALGLDKLAMDVRSKAYVDRDCAIIREGLERLTETCRRFGLRHPANTLGGLCVKLWKAMGGVNHPDHSQNSRDAIFGGRVELFSRGGRGNILWTDINSLYPWAMTQEFPAALERVDKHAHRLRRWGITQATVEVPEQWLAPLPYRAGKDELAGVGEGAIIFPCGRFSGTWTNHELRVAMELHGAKLVGVREQWGTDRASHPYRDFVLQFYQLRMEQKDEAYRLIYKLLMNNLYGQLGMGGTITRTCRMDERKARALREGRINATVFGRALLFDTRIPLPDHVNYAHAAHVTSYSRLRFMEFFRAIGPENAIYGDTDSAMFFQDPHKPLPFKTGSGLGEMKIEGFARRIDVQAPKTYRIVARDKDGLRFSAHAKAKGVPKAQARHFLRTGWAEYDAPFKVREAIAFFDREVKTHKPDGRPVYVAKARGNARRLSVWRLVRKELRSRYAKKRARKNGMFTPLVLS